MGTWAGLVVQGGVVVAVRDRAFVPLTVLIMAVTAVSCSKAEGADYGDGSAAPESTPSIIIPSSPAKATPAKDCKQSTVALSPKAEMEGVQLEASTDPTLTSMLLKNTGSLSVIVVPDANFTTRLVAAPYASPTDDASKAALSAAVNSGSLGVDSGLPAYVPLSQVFIVPPQWAVCALTDVVKETAGVRYMRDKRSSAEYFVAKGLADALFSKFKAPKAAPALLKCTKNTLQLLKEHPDLQGAEFYAEILGAKSSCRAGYKALLGNDEHAAQQTGTSVLNVLEGTPALLETTRLYDALAQG